MDTNATAAERGLPDLRDQVDLMVGKLTTLGANLRAGRSDPAADADIIDQAMLMLARLHEVIAWEPGAYRRTPQGVAEQLRAMAQVGPRPPAVVKLLTEAAGHLAIAQSASDEARVVPDQDMVALLRVAERLSYTIAEDALAQGRRLAELVELAAAR